VAAPAQARRELVGDHPVRLAQPPAHVLGDGHPVLLRAAVRDGEPGPGREHVGVGRGRLEGAQRVAMGVARGDVEPVPDALGPVEVPPVVGATGALVLNRLDEARRVRAETVVPVLTVQRQAPGHRGRRAGVEALDRRVVHRDGPALRRPGTGRLARLARVGRTPRHPQHHQHHRHDPSPHPSIMPAHGRPRRLPIQGVRTCSRVSWRRTPLERGSTRARMYTSILSAMGQVVRPDWTANTTS
jgi:hypothetical protein